MHSFYMFLQPCSVDSEEALVHLLFELLKLFAEDA